MNLPNQSSRNNPEKLERVIKKYPPVKKDPKSRQIGTLAGDGARVSDDFNEPLGEF